mmetsp:Transcript_104981/g.254834  ORF Transcript_104981/g.254834 Transcript_104981/m.254834 type:complete len:240 (+) Transcript_104981:482-1201(+)
MGSSFWALNPIERVNWGRQLAACCCLKRRQLASAAHRSCRKWCCCIGIVSSNSMHGTEDRRHLNTTVLRLLRLLRVVRELKNLRSFQFMTTAMVRMFCAARVAVAAQGVVLFAFAALCVNCFGGVIYRGNPLLEGSDYDEKNWTIFNFNDMPMAFFTWFTQLLNEYSNELVDAIFRASPFGELGWWLVPAFYLIAVAIFFEILVAFMIETFLALKEEAEEEEEDAEDQEGDSEEETLGD